MKRRIGDILVEMGFIGRDQLEMAVVESKKTKTMIGDILLRLDWITEEQLQMVIAVQSGAQILDPDQTEIEVDDTLTANIPQSFVTNHGVFPFAREGQTIKVATANPFDVLVRDQLTRMTGCQIESYVAPKKWIGNQIELHYKAALSIDSDMENIAYGGGEGDALGENQIVRLADLMIAKGVVLSASDIHVVPDINLVRIYYRIDGVLHQENLFPIRFHQGLVTRYKIMGNMDISNPNIPHDGRIKYEGNFGEIDIRVSTFPTHLGEAIVLRLLTFSKIVGDLEHLGLEKEDLGRFLARIRRPYGLILATGPTGSGKTTTLYSALMSINSPHVNVMTIEDPIEYLIPTVRQTPTNPKAGMTFGNALRSAMRQDPDIILVGEIRDQETAELALRASLTGHLVLSTLHTNEAAAAISRLLDLGVNPSIVATALTMVVAQRLLRRLCPRCAVSEPLADHEREIFGLQGIEAPETVRKPRGCGYCRNTGYKGRIGVFEVLCVNREIEEMIFSGALHSRLEEAAVKSGTDLLFAQALKKVGAGDTSMEEVYRVVAYA